MLLGRNPGPLARGGTLDKLLLPAVPAGLPSELLERRPDIRRAEQQLVAANARIGVAKAAFYPSISLTGLLGVASADLSNLFTGDARTWTYAGLLSQPIFTGGTLAGQLARIRSAAEAGALRLPAGDPDRVRRDRKLAGGPGENAASRWRRRRRQVEALGRYA